MTDKQPPFEVTEFQLEIARNTFVPVPERHSNVSDEELGRFVLKTFNSAAETGSLALTATLLTVNFQLMPYSYEETMETAQNAGEHHLAEGMWKSLIQRTRIQVAGALRETSGLPADKQHLGAAFILARSAYQGFSRLEGGPFFMHPTRMAAMRLHVDQELAAKGFGIATEETDAEIIKALFHDSVEKTGPTSKNYDYKRQDHFDPLLLYVLLSNSGFDPELKEEIVKDVLALTHFKDEPWALDWPNQVRQKIIKERPSAIPTKDVDRVDNGENESISKTAAKYKSMKPELRQAELDNALSEQDEERVREAHRILDKLPKGRIQPGILLKLAEYIER